MKDRKSIEFRFHGGGGLKFRLFEESKYSMNHLKFREDLGNVVKAISGMGDAIKKRFQCLIAEMEFREEYQKNRPESTYVIRSGYVLIRRFLYAVLYQELLPAILNKYKLILMNTKTVYYKILY